MSEVKVNKISPRTACGTVTLGDSGDTFTIPSGATINNQGTAVNFGATGSASWVTTVKTTDFTAVAGEGYFVNTTSGEIDVTLPASPSAGAVVAVKDYANTWDTNNCILLRNGSNIGGQALDSILNTEGLAVTLVYVDATKGWLVTDSGLQSEAPGPQYITATGGTPTTSPCGNFKIHTFTGPGTFAVSNAGNASGSNSVSYMVVGGGGGGSGGGPASSTNGGGGGGAGGFRESKASSDSYTASPLNATSGPTYDLAVAVQSYTIAIGGGAPPRPGSGNPRRGCSGVSSTFSTIVSAGGGGGGCGTDCSPTWSIGLAGGSGGGAGWKPSPGGTAGAGNTPPVSPPQGQPGGNNTGGGAGAGGGGAGATGSNDSSPNAGPGGAGVTTSINATPTTRAGGGGGGRWSSGSISTGGPGGGGNGGSEGGGACGSVNTGGGGGGAGAYPGACTNGGAGGSGIVIIRYKFQ